MKLRARASGREIELRPGLVLGRAEDSGVVVADESVSRHHARFEQRGERWWFVDLKSSNGTRLNGVRSTAGFLSPGDLLTLGSVAFDVVGAATVVAQGEPAAAEPARGGAGAPQRAAAEAERTRLRRAEARALQRARGWGDLAQQSFVVRLLALAIALAVMLAIALGVRWLGHALAGR